MTANYSTTKHHLPQRWKQRNWFKVTVWWKTGRKWIFVSRDTPIKRVQIGSFCLAISAHTGQAFQSYGQKCEHAKLRRVCVTCRLTEKQGSEQKSAKKKSAFISHSKTTCHQRPVGGCLTWLLACWNGWIIRTGLGFEFSWVVQAPSYLTAPGMWAEL